MLRPVLAAAVVLGAFGLPRGAGASDEPAALGSRPSGPDSRTEVAARGEPRAFTPDREELAALLADVEPPCRPAADRAFHGGRIQHACARDVMRAGGRRLRHAPERFGIVLHRRVDLIGARLVVEQASGCREWPTSQRGHILAEFDGLAAGCRLRPYRGDLALVLVAADGRRVEVTRVRADREGVVQLRFADIDMVARERGLGTLDDWAALEVGHDGWAGRFDLVRLRGFLADWHFSWVKRGRGTPALFALRHREHPRSQVAFDLAVEASLARQQRDYAAVERGILPPATFLDRYVWSPMRHSVESMLAEVRSRARSETQPRKPTRASASSP